MAEPLVVDANVLLSALLGGAAREVVFSGDFELYSTQHTLFEVEKYLPRMAEKLGQPVLDLFKEFQLLPVVACQPNRYDSHVEAADRLIGRRDPKDVQILALTLRLGCPIWTEDRDFENLPDVTVRKTADLLALP